MKMKFQLSLLAKKFNKYGAEGVQGAIGKLPGCARRREIFCACKKVSYDLQKR